MPQAGVPGKAGFPKKEEHLKRKRRTIYLEEAEWKAVQEFVKTLREEKK